MLGRGPRRWYLSTAFVIATVAFAGSGDTARAGENTVLLLDASNSMNSAMGGTRRIDAAKSAISDTAPRYQNTLDIGLVTFGNRQRQSCRDIETLAAPAAGNANRVVAGARSITAQGVSMLAQGLQRAATDAAHRQGPASVIAVVDGAGIDSCRVDTCETATQLKREARDLTVHVIAVAPKADEVAKLECVASITGGTYVAVSESGQLRNAMDLAFNAVATGAKTATSTRGGAAPTPQRKPREPIYVAAAPGPRMKPDPDSPDPVLDEPGAAPGDDDGDNTVSVFAPTRPAREAEALAPSSPTPAGAARNDGGNENQVVMSPTAAASGTINLTPGQSRTQTDNTQTASVQPETPAPAAEAPMDAPVDAPVDRPAMDMSATSAEPGVTVLYKRPQAMRKDAAQTASVAPEAATDSGAAAPANGESESATGAPVVNLSAEPAADTPATEPAADSANQDIAAANPAPPPTTAPPGEELEGEGTVQLSALIVEGSAPVPEGMLWQVFELSRDGGRGPLATRSSDPSPTLNLPAGAYMIEGRFGNAERSMPVVVKPNEQADAQLVLDVGGLQLVPAVAGVPNTDAEIVNKVFAASDPRTPVVDKAASGAIIYLSAGAYRIVSQYGNANSVAEDEIQIQRGKLTQAKINHRAAPVTFRLVEAPGGAPQPDATWVISDDSKTIKRSEEASPTYVLVEGEYQVAVSQNGKTFSRTFTVKQGAEETVEILAQ